MVTTMKVWISLVALAMGKLDCKDVNVKMVIVIDTSNSFVEAVHEFLDDSFAPFQRQLYERFKKAEVAVVTYIDKQIPFRGNGMGRGYPGPMDYCYKNAVPMSAEIRNVSVHNSIQFGVGGDEYENPYEGLIYGVLDPTMGFKSFAEQESEREERAWSRDADADGEEEDDALTLNMAVLVADNLPHVMGDGAQGIKWWNPADDGLPHILTRDFPLRAFDYYPIFDDPVYEGKSSLKAYNIWCQYPDEPEDLAYFGPIVYEPLNNGSRTFDDVVNCDKFEYPGMAEISAVLHSKDIIPVMVYGKPDGIHNQTRLACNARGYDPHMVLKECVGQYYVEDFATMGYPNVTNFNWFLGGNRSLTGLTPRLIEALDNATDKFPLCYTTTTPAPTTLLTTLETTNPSTFPTTVETTFPTTFPTTLETTFPTTFPTTLETTLPTTFPTTLETTNPTTVETTYPTTIGTTNPTTYQTTLETIYLTTMPPTNPTTISTTMASTNPTTMPPTNPTTIPTTIPITVLTTLPPTDPTTISTTMASTNPTTMPPTNPTTIPTTIPITALTTLPPASPATIPTTVLSTLRSTVPTTLITTIPTTIPTTIQTTIATPPIVMPTVPIVVPTTMPKTLPRTTTTTTTTPKTLSTQVPLETTVAPTTTVRSPNTTPPANTDLTPANSSPAASSHASPSESFTTATMSPATSGFDTTDTDYSSETDLIPVPVPLPICIPEKGHKHKPDYVVPIVAATAGAIGILAGFMLRCLSVREPEEGSVELIGSSEEVVIIEGTGDDCSWDAYQ